MNIKYKWLTKDTKAKSKTWKLVLSDKHLCEFGWITQYTSYFYATYPYPNTRGMIELGRFISLEFAQQTVENCNNPQECGLFVIPLLASQIKTVYRFFDKKGNIHEKVLCPSLSNNGEVAA